MITKDIALTLKKGDILQHKTLKGLDEKPMQAKVNGKCKTLKSSTLFFQLPVIRKVMKRVCSSFYIDNINGTDWKIPDALGN